ncbi:outer membrane protein assembly factor BamE [Orbus wheelerorum]|uniref:outer membrane protein assembly factor BamE n=1 Tax=Orbus wheelerorum TaxID=3074111 RepID=UPI00370DD30F
MFSYRSITMLAITMLLLSGCSFVDRWVYRPDINQGNYITQTEVDKLKVGQTKEQVVYVMGNPMLSSVFTDNVWYYIFRELPEHGYVSQKTYTIIFDQKGNVTDIKESSIGKENLEQMDNEKELN